MKITQGSNHEGLFAAALALSTLGKAIGGIREMSAQNNAENDQSFQNAALVQGKPVTSIPGGFFRRALSHTGLVSPDIQASPNQLNEESLALQNQSLGRLKTAHDILDFKSLLGHEGFSKMMNAPEGAGLKAQLTAAGISPDSATGESDAEKKEDAVLAQQQLTNRRLQDSADETKRYHQVEAGNSAARLAIAQRNLNNAAIRMSPAYQQQEATSRAIGTANAVPEMNLTAFSKVGSFIDPDTMEIIKPNQAKNVGDAMEKYPMIGVHDLPYYKLAKGALDAIDRRIALANELLPSTAGMNTFQANAAIKKNQGRMLFSGANNPDVREWKDTSFSSAIQPAITALQHRYASAATAHLDAPAFGDASMSREAAIQNLMQMKNTLKSAYIGGVQAETPATTTSAISSLPPPAAAVESFESGDDD